MSSIRALSGFNAETVTYRPLTVAQIDRLQPFARPRDVERGEVLCPGDVAMPLYLVLSARVAIEE
jgi:hypothetical protein